MTLNFLVRPARSALIGLQVVAALALAPTGTEAQPAPLPPTPWKVACAPVGSSRSVPVGANIVTATSMGVSPENPDYCKLMTSSGPRDFFLVSVSPPSPAGRAEAAAKLQDLFAGRFREVEFDLEWLRRQVLKTHEKWLNVGTGVLPLENEPPLNVITFRRHVIPIIGGYGEGILDVTLPVVDGTVLLFPVAETVPDPSKSLDWVSWKATRFKIPE